MRLHTRNVVFTDLKNSLGDLCSRLLLVLFSLIMRIFTLTFLWIYFDSKTMILLITILVINFTLSYKLEYRSSRKSLSNSKFSLWITSFVNIFSPCWYYRNISDNVTHDEILQKIAVLSLPNNFLMAFWIIICYFLVNWTDFKYNNNVLNNDEFIVSSLSLFMFILINTFLYLIYLNPSWSFNKSRSLLTIVTCILCFCSTIVIGIFYKHLHFNQTITIITQHYQDAPNKPLIYLKSYRASRLRPDTEIANEITGEIFNCSSIISTDGFMVCV